MTGHPGAGSPPTTSPIAVLSASPAGGARHPGCPAPAGTSSWGRPSRRHLDHPVALAGRAHAQAGGRAQAQQLAGGDIELPRVRGARQRRALEAALRKRRAAVRARVVEGEDALRHAHDADRHALDRDAARRPDRDVLGREDGMEVAHPGDRSALRPAAKDVRRCVEKRWWTAWPSRTPRATSGAAAGSAATTGLITSLRATSWWPSSA